MLPPQAVSELPTRPPAGWLRRFHEEATAFFERHEVPGAAVAIVNDGEPVYLSGFGYADRERGMPASASTLFGVASVSKSFTALSVLALAAQGRLTLTEPVTKHLPGFNYPGFKDPSGVTVAHLLSHTSGLPPLRTLALALSGEWPIPGTAELLAYLREAPGERRPLPGPGRYLSYSNEGVALAGAVVEAVTGLPLDDAFQELVAAPLGIGATFAGAKAEATGRLTQYYSPVDGSVEPVERASIDAFLGTGALMASVEDLATYLAYLLGGEVARKLPLPSALRSELTRGRAWSAPYSRYALGWTVMKGVRGPSGPWAPLVGEGFTLVRHGGSLAGVSAHVGFAPRLGLGVAVLTNLDQVPVLRLFTEAFNAYLDLPVGASLFPVPGESARPEPAVARRLAGSYSSGEPWGRLELKVSDDGRLLAFTGEEGEAAGELRLLSEREFVLVVDGETGGRPAAWEAGRFLFPQGLKRSRAPHAVQFGTRWLDRR